MPRKNARKTYIKDGLYHVYNRGVEKRSIFNNKKDYQVFLNLFKEHLSPPPKYMGTRTVTMNQRQVELPVIPRSNFYEKITLLCYCLMPNHFHLLIKQHDDDSLGRYMKSIGLRYSMYFNKTNKRKGKLFEGRYKAVRVSTDEQLLHLSRYIHLNPTSLPLLKRARPLRKGLALTLFSQPSSYPDYLGKKKTSWIKTKTVLDYFKSDLNPNKNQHKSYQSFVEEQANQHSPLIDHLTIDDS